MTGNTLLVDYSPKMVELLMDGTKVLLSLTTGFLTVVAASCRYLYDQRLMTRARWPVLATFLFGLASVAAWILSIGATVVAAKAFDLPEVVDVIALTSRLKSRWALAVHSTQFALSFFFLSLAIYCATVVRLFWSQPHRANE